MAMVPVKCPNCRDTKVEKAGKQPNGTERYRCCNELCSRAIFQLEYKYNAYNPDIKIKTLEMAINGSKICDTARALKISTNTVIDVFKKGSVIKSMMKSGRAKINIMDDHSKSLIMISNLFGNAVALV